MHEKVAELYHGYINNDLVALGWTVEQVLPHGYNLIDVSGHAVFATCHMEQYLDYNRYSVFIKIDDDLMPIGTVAEVDGQYEIFKMD